MTAVPCAGRDGRVHGKPFHVASPGRQPSPPFKGHIYRILLLIDECSCSVCVEIAPSGLVKSHHRRAALTGHFQHNKKNKKIIYYVSPRSTLLSPILDSKYSSAALSLRRHWPGNRINGRHFSLPQSSIRGICFVRGADVWDPRGPEERREN